MRLWDAVVRSIEVVGKQAVRTGVRMRKPVDGAKTVFVFEDGADVVTVTVEQEPASLTDQVRAAFGVGPAEMFAAVPDAGKDFK